MYLFLVLTVKKLQISGLYQGVLASTLRKVPKRRSYVVFEQGAPFRAAGGLNIAKVGLGSKL